MLVKERGLLNENSNKARPPARSVREVMEARIERLGQDGKEVASGGP